MQVLTYSVREIKLCEYIINTSNIYKYEACPKERNNKLKGEKEMFHCTSAQLHAEHNPHKRHAAAQMHHDNRHIDTSTCLRALATWA